MTKAHITLIPKEGKDHTICSNFRPISLLNTDLKLLAKLLANRLAKILPTLIYRDQVGFVKNREGKDNTARVLNILHHVKKQAMPLVLLSTDAEKAFDRINWSFMYSVLRSNNFPNTFVQAVKAMYLNASASIMVNDTISAPFLISNGTRQGCPLSSLLFVLTLEPFLQTIRLEGDVQGITLGDQQHKIAAFADDMLIMTSPFTSKPFDTCAVVGNGGILQNSSCGREIDKMDFVFRFNLPPMTIVDDIGNKSDFVSANPSILNTRFQKLLERRKSFIELVKSYGSAMIILPAFSYVGNMHVSFRALHSVQDFDLPNKIAFFHPEYLKNLSIYWKEEGLKVKRLSSGLMLVSAAIELCDKVTLYGFWPFPQDPEGHTISHHYYDNKMPKPGFHSMPEEFYFYTQMHLKGVLHLKVGQCSLGGS
ncbi:alpha-2,8-sialyltransferase 8E-like [Bufo gargarizans]|uniref:alpha-2,8-sialyltransferase 8E-like n=1 Tax=Bufo gargarizans TaxID=30331 RepID=UPI001CF1952D|nr:alpha-2,8-sialyltransferase 8E-like [Bufo gargarizans]